MSYADDRPIHDADAHLMELPDFLSSFADPSIRDLLPKLHLEILKPGEASAFEQYDAMHKDPEFRADDRNQIMLRKNYLATGSFVPHDRPAALDLLGFCSQLIFNTFTSGRFAELENDVSPTGLNVLYGSARAHNRAMQAFCSVDNRLLPTMYVPLASFERSAEMAQECIEMGAAALLIPSACPAQHSPSHIEFDRVWAIAQDSGVPIVFHVGGGGQLLSPSYFKNGMPPVPDFHGGAENFRSIDYMAIPYWPMQTLSTLLFDGVLDRFPRLKWGVIEQGASWLPGWMRNLDAAFGAFRKNEERLQKLRDKPSEIVRQQVRVTPYPHEDAGWVITNSGPEICMFSSDYPHVEGGRNPLKRFDEHLALVDEETRQRFYFDNMVDFMGDVLVRHGLPTRRSDVLAGSRNS